MNVCMYLCVYIYIYIYIYIYTNKYFTYMFIYINVLHIYFYMNVIYIYLYIIYIYRQRNIHPPTHKHAQTYTYPALTEYVNLLPVYTPDSILSWFNPVHTITTLHPVLLSILFSNILISPANRFFLWGFSPIDMCEWGTSWLVLPTIYRGGHLVSISQKERTLNSFCWE